MSARFSIRTASLAITLTVSAGFYLSISFMDVEEETTSWRNEAAYFDGVAKETLSLLDAGGFETRDECVEVALVHSASSLMKNRIFSEGTCLPASVEVDFSGCSEEATEKDSESRATEALSSAPTAGRVALTDSLQRLWERSDVPPSARVQVTLARAWLSAFPEVMEATRVAGSAPYTAQVFTVDPSCAEAPEGSSSGGDSEVSSSGEDSEVSSSGEAALDTPAT